MSNEKNEDSNGNLTKPSSKDKLALVTSLIFLVAIGTLGYKYFNSSNNLSLNPLEQKLSNIGDSISQSIENTKSKLSKSNEEMGETSSASTTRENEEKMVISNNTNGITDTQWIANDYHKGDINEGSYTVKSGDTLWEIAEAVYGNGSAWTNILSANSSSIGYLANGQQALIFPGQVLTLPSIT